MGISQLSCQEVSNPIGCKQVLEVSPLAKPEYYPICVQGVLYIDTRFPDRVVTRSGPTLKEFLVIKKKGCQEEPRQAIVLGN
jgi:hypothetical protein